MTQADHPYAGRRYADETHEVTPTDKFVYKVGFPTGTLAVEAAQEAEKRLRETGREMHQEAVIESFERIQTDEHEAAGEFLVVIRGSWVPLKELEADDGSGE